jgi:hypothetical protein
MAQTIKLTAAQWRALEVLSEGPTWGGARSAPTRARRKVSSMAAHNLAVLGLATREWEGGWTFTITDAGRLALRDKPNPAPGS